MWTGWDVVAEAEWRRLRVNGRDEIPGPVDVGPSVVAAALVAELQRPPWYRELDRARRELAREEAGRP